MFENGGFSLRILSFTIDLQGSLEVHLRCFLFVEAGPNHAKQLIRVRFVSAIVEGLQFCNRFLEEADRFLRIVGKEVLARANIDQVKNRRVLVSHQVVGCAGLVQVIEGLFLLESER